jgi:cellulose synthase/poly-beta-1,6-N-acetylglucosamine synthase-like glycosyltransferase
MSHWFWLVIGLLLGAVWLGASLLTVFGMKKLEDLRKPQWDKLGVDSDLLPTITVVVPARNEAANIEPCLRSLLTQDYPKLTVCAVDDRSSDQTGPIMDRLAGGFPDRLQVIHVSHLPAGWLGKTHAMWLGAQQTSSDWILFTDGDILFRHDALRRALAYAETAGCDHLMLFPTMISKSVGEGMMLAYFGLTSVVLVRPWKVRDPRSKAFVGAGSFNLIRRPSYEELGTYQALRMEVIDDLMLGRAVKEQGLKEDCALGMGLVSVRWAEGTLGVVRNLQKNLFSLLRFSWVLAALAALATAAYQLGPWFGLLLAPGIAKVGFAIAVLSIILLYARVGPIFEFSPWYFVTHPAAALLMMYALANSAASSLIHGGVQWRGTTYSLNEIQASNEKARREGEERRRARSNSYSGPERRRDAVATAKANAKSSQ